jgi:hypothetical protein
MLEIFDLAGQRIETLIRGRQAAGFYQIEWVAGVRPSGVYMFRFRAGNYISIRKGLLLK